MRGTRRRLSAQVGRLSISFLRRVDHPEASVNPAAGPGMEGRDRDRGRGSKQGQIQAQWSLRCEKMIHPRY